MPAFEDLTGKKFGHLTAIKPLGGNKWLWRCDCGQEKVVLATSVKRGVTQSCGTSCKYSPKHQLKNDLTGMRFGRLVVLHRVERFKTASGKRCTYYACVCDCGNQTVVTAGHLTTGHTLSCGCAHKEQEEAWKSINYKHGRTIDRTPTKSYLRWEQIKRRCYNPTDVSYPFYGEKGIKMWDGWTDNPTAFCEYVESLDGYDVDGSTIDRIDYTKGYEPGNLRWISLAEQQRNKSSNRLITANGETHILQEWENITGLKRGVIAQRLERGWTPEEAVNTPTLHGKKLYNKAPIPSRYQ